MCRQPGWQFSPWIHPVPPCYHRTPPRLIHVLYLRKVVCGLLGLKQKTNKEEDVELSPQGHHCLGLPLGLSGKTKLLPLKPPSLHALPLKEKKAKERETQDQEPNLNVCSPTHPASTCPHVLYMGLLFCSFLCSDRVSSFKVQLSVEEQAPFWVEPISANDSSLCVSTA